MRLTRLLFVTLLALLPSLAQAQRERLPLEDLEIVEKKWPNAKKTGSGLRTVVLQEGTGDTPKPGDFVDVLYTGMLIDGKVFDQALDPKQPFSFQVARDKVIDGYDEALQLMRVGEKRILIVPYELGYGYKGKPPHIPRRATLVFEVELIRVRKP